MADATTYEHSQIRVYYGNPGATVLADLTDSLAGDISVVQGGTVTTERRNKTATGRIGMAAYGESADQGSVSLMVWLSDEVDKVLNNPSGRIWVERLDSGKVTVMPCFCPSDSQNAPVPGGQQMQLTFSQAVFTHSATDIERGVVVGSRSATAVTDKALLTGEVAYIRTSSGIKRATVAADNDIAAGEVGMQGVPIVGESEA